MADTFNITRLPIDCFRFIVHIESKVIKQSKTNHDIKYFMNLLAITALVAVDI